MGASLRDSILRAGGDLFGTTAVGGVNGFGTVFELTPTRGEKVLCSFSANDGGGYPEAVMVRDKQHNLYGTTSGFNGAYGNGAIFEVSPTGVLTILYQFSGVDGLNPNSVVHDTEGNLYGTTYGGGASGHGTVFELTPNGKKTVLHSFTGGTDGSYPAAGLLRYSTGDLYGTTTGGGNGYGTVFKVTKTGVETVLYSFNGGADGNEPDAGVVFDKQGNLFGTTVNGGIANSHCPDGCGVVFKIVP
jgi:uncharacterized repeat protein (TIGR03803 family)